MKLELKRFSGQKDSTLGLLFLDGLFACFTLEDEYRDIKVKGETRIPAGTYKVEKRKVDSGLTQKYKDKYSWFDYHFMLQDVPNFNYVYIHVGNDDDHTDGCLLVGDGVLSNLSTENNNLNTSAQAYERIYKQMSKSSSPIEIVISDEKEMLGYESC
jgi:hypothetical protein|tara:strand:+ start:364 stop:834 length:471 start_codon:yes stop_codon:yes gene_type:complete